MINLYLSVLETDEDRCQFEDIYRQYKNRMYKFAISILHNNEDAEDVVHQSFLTIANNFDKIKSFSCHEMNSYIVIIIRNTAINRYHYNQHRVHTSIDELDNVLYDETPSPMDLVIEADQYNELLNKIRSLDPIYRDVILLKYLYDYDNGTIASLTGVAEATVRVRLMRARQLLDELLKGGKADE